MTYSYVKTNKV